MTTVSETAARAVERVRLELFASKLKNVAGAFKGISDPYAIVTLLADKPGEQPKVLGKTEVIKNNLSPHWTTYFDLEYSIGKQTRVNVGIYDEIRKEDTDKIMGSALFEVGEVLGARGNIKAKRLRTGGTLFCRITPSPVVGTPAAAGCAPRTTSAVSSSLSSKIHIKLRGENLKNPKGLAKPNPFLELSAQVITSSGTGIGGQQWQVLIRSPAIKHTLDPVWDTLILDVDRFHGGGNAYLGTPLRIQVWDWQKNGKHRNMGRVETTISAMMAAIQPMTLHVHEKEVGVLRTDSVVILDGNGQERPAISILHEVDFGSVLGDLPPAATSNPTVPPDHAKTQSASTPPLSSSSISSSPPRSSSSPVPFAMALGRGDRDAAIMSSESASFTERSAPFAPSAPPAPSAPYAPTDTIFVGYSDLPPPLPAPPQRPKFIDYITGGCELELCIAIDFTGSNGDPRKPGTLHYMHPNRYMLNDYEKALTAVGGIIAKYGHDQRFPVWGFGAKYGGVIQHCFRIGDADELNGIDTVLQAYRNVFHTGLTMSGPTVFEEVIGMAAAKARSKHQAAREYNHQVYEVLLILTDGAVSDVEATRRAILAASDAPLSIVIVGIGEADFSAMQFLDNFQNGNTAGRDICQFVEFRRYQHDRSALTQQTLEEIPDQLVDFFFAQNNILPLPARDVSQVTLSNIPIEDPTDYDIDLDLSMNSNGNFYVGNTNGAVYDDTKYTLGGSSVPPSSMSATYNPHSAASYNPPNETAYQPFHASPVAPYQPHTPTGPFSSHGGAPGTYQLSHHPQQSQQQQQQQQYHHHHHEYTTSHLPSPTTAVATRGIFYVQVPPGVSAGQQLRVQSPYTQQEMIVTVPAGVGPGGKFGVQS